MPRPTILSTHVYFAFTAGRHFIIAVLVIMIDHQMYDAAFVKIHRYRLILTEQHTLLIFCAELRAALTSHARCQLTHADFFRHINRP